MIKYYMPALYSTQLSNQKLFVLIIMGIPVENPV